ncbi:hypothetical protein C7974DRAFT_375529 [Boeremia exigua]|uniref:uncharacterized protein n=1 Tax=Boeremia exigua TaxID=749465 RepID=UPI001E8DC9E9|nr:uncharacterized protein C7974DRAFT_375529 [Boeremia exigua]KAH6633446.1 hypothetical protein C7974DRAFT_375529 [Boeremia exigua]
MSSLASGSLFTGRTAAPQELGPPHKPTSLVATALGLERTRAPAKYAVGVDFGTTNSSVSFSVAHNPSVIHTVNKYPDTLRDQLQVTTQLAYLNYAGLIDLDEDKIGALRSGRVPHREPYRTRRDRRQAWGYEAQSLSRLNLDEGAEQGYRPKGHILRPKLIFSMGRNASASIAWEAVEELKTRKVIRKREDVVRDIFVELLKHAKAYLTEYHGYQEGDTVELGVGIPADWDRNNIMKFSAVVHEAATSVQFGGAPFLVHEPEAYAINIVESQHFLLTEGSIVVTVDAGGGSTDLSAYRLAYSQPLRLESEGIEVGAEDLDVRFLAFMKKWLQSQPRFLELASMDAERATYVYFMDKWTNDHKRNFSLADRGKGKTYTFRVTGLQAAPSNPRFKQNQLSLTFDDMERIFDPSLRAVRKKAKSYIANVLSTMGKVDQVILVGGFGDSPALQEVLRDMLKEFQSSGESNIEFCTFRHSGGGVTGVSKGIVRRIQNKSNGPARVIQRSIGVLTDIPYGEFERYPEDIFKDQKLTVSEYDGGQYITEAIVWWLKVDMGELRPLHRVCYRTKFVCPLNGNNNRGGWEASQHLVSSFTCTKDYYQRHHKNNRGKTDDEGKFFFDLTQYMTTAFEVVTPDESVTKTHYAIELLMCLELNGSNVDMMARYPANEDGELIYKSGHQLQPIYMAGAFGPGM